MHVPSSNGPDEPHDGGSTDGDGTTASGATTDGGSTSGTAGRATRQGGDVRPSARRLERPPGERYGSPRPERLLDRPDLGRAALAGLAVSCGIVAVLALLHAILSVTAGRIAVAALGGWLLGGAVRSGAWGGQAHRPSRAPTLVAVALGGATWVVAQAAAWLLSLAILPGSSRTLPERLAATPFLDWLWPQLGPLDLVELLLLVGVAAWSSRAPALERPV